jgi:hypothetical protein
MADNPPNVRLKAATSTTCHSHGNACAQYHPARSAITTSVTASTVVVASQRTHRAPPSSRCRMCLLGIRQSCESVANNAFTASESSTLSGRSASAAVIASTDTPAALAASSALSSVR